MSHQEAAVYIDRPEFARRLAARWTVLVLLALLAGCLAPSSPDRQSSMPVASWFPDNPQAQALAIASEHGDVAEIQRLMKVEGVDPDKIFSKDGYPLLVWPVLTKNPVGLKAMLENGADPNAAMLVPLQNTSRFKGRYEDNAMVWAAKASDTKYLEILLDHGGDPDTRNSNGETLMLQAFLSSDNAWGNVKLLVERGADVNARSQGSTILSDYTGRGGFERALWLLEHGADPKLNFLRSPAAAPDQSHIIDEIFWYPSKPEYVEWQRKCQQWLLKRGYKRPPMPDRLRDMRKSFGYPHEERDIPLL